MIKNEDSVLLSEYCFNVCETLTATIQGKGADDLNESARTALEDLKRCAYVYHLPPSLPPSEPI